MSETTASRIGRMSAAWLYTPAVLVVAYFATYYATVSPVERRLRIQPGLTRAIRLDAPEPTYSISIELRALLPARFWERIFAPAWRVDRIVRPGMWRERHSNSEGPYRPQRPATIY